MEAPAENPAWVGEAADEDAPPPGWMKSGIVWDGPDWQNVLRIMVEECGRTEQSVRGFVETAGRGSFNTPQEALWYLMKASHGSLRAPEFEVYDEEVFDRIISGECEPQVIVG